MCSSCDTRTVTYLELEMCMSDSVQLNGALEQTRSELANMATDVLVRHGIVSRERKNEENVSVRNASTIAADFWLSLSLTAVGVSLIAKG